MPQTNGTEWGEIVTVKVTDTGGVALGVYVKSTLVEPDGGMTTPMEHPAGGHTTAPPAPPSWRSTSKMLSGFPVTSTGTTLACPASKTTTASGSSVGVPMHGGRTGGGGGAGGAGSAL